MNYLNNAIPIHTTQNNRYNKVTGITICGKQNNNIK